MLQITSVDLLAQEIRCEVAPAPITTYPIGIDFASMEHLVEGKDYQLVSCGVREFDNHGEAYQFLRDKKPLVIYNNPAFWLMNMEGAFDWRPGVWLWAWWPGASEGDKRRDTPFIRYLKRQTHISYRKAYGDVKPCDYDKQVDQLYELLMMTDEELDEVIRRAPLIEEWAARCAESGKRYDAADKDKTTF